MSIPRSSLLVALAFLLGLAVTAPAAPKIKVGQKAPDFALKSLDGSTVKLSQYQGKKVVLVEFFTTDCPWCAKAAPNTRKLFLRYRSKGLQVVAVSVGDSAGAVRSWVGKNNYTGFPVLLDSDRKTRSAYGVSIVPTQVLVDKSGKVLQLYRGWTPKVEEAVGQDALAAATGKPLPKHDFPLVGHG